MGPQMSSCMDELKLVALDKDDIEEQYATEAAG